MAVVFGYILKNNVTRPLWIKCPYPSCVGNYILCFFVVVQSVSHVWPFVTPWTTARQASLSFTVFWSLLKVMSMESVMPSNHLILCRLLLLLPSIFPSIRVFFNEAVLHIRWPKYWSFIISLSNEYSGLIFFRIDWFDPFAVQGTLKSLLQHHSWKASILWRSELFRCNLNAYKSTQCMDL